MQFQAEYLPQILETVFFIIIIVSIQFLPDEEDFLKKIRKVRISAYVLLVIIAVTLVFIEPTAASRLFYALMAFVLVVAGIALSISIKKGEKTEICRG